MIIFGLGWLYKDIEHYICNSHMYLRGRLSSFRSTVVVHDIEIALDLLKFRVDAMKEREWRIKKVLLGLKLCKFIESNKVL